MNLHEHLHLAHGRAQDLRDEARRDHLARAARPAPERADRPRVDLRALLVRLHLA